MPLSSSPAFSSPAHSPLSPSPTHISRSHLFGEQLTAAMRSLLSVLVEGHGSPWMARVWGGFGSSLVPAALVEKPGSRTG